jgi:hypothetical protein
MFNIIGLARCTEVRVENLYSVALIQYKSIFILVVGLLLCTSHLHCPWAIPFNIHTPLLTRFSEGGLKF